MSDFNPPSRADKKDLRLLCKKLKDRGISTVQMDFDGYADDGSVTVSDVQGPDGKENLVDKLSDDERLKLEEAAYEILPWGWDNEDGATGAIKLDAESMLITVDYGYRVITWDYEEIDLRTKKEQEVLDGGE